MKDTILLFSNPQGVRQEGQKSSIISINFNSGSRIAQILSDIDVNIQKLITY